MKAKIKAFFKEIWNYIKTSHFLKNFAGMIGFVVLFFFLLFWGLKCFTKHGSSKAVPDLVGLSKEEAIKVADKADMSIVIQDTLWKGKTNRGRIMSQFPLAESYAKKGRQIFVTAGTFEFPKINIAKKSLIIIGQDFEQVKRRLARSNIKLVKKGEVPGEVPNTVEELIYKGENITIEYIEAREKGKEFTIPEESTLYCNVAKAAEIGYSNPEDLNIICKTLTDARFMLSSYRINIGSIVDMDNLGNYDESSVYVTRIYPSAAERPFIKQGEQIDLYISQTKPFACDDGANDFPDGDVDEEGNNDDPFR